MSERPAITALGNGRYEVADGPARRLAYAVRSGGETWVFLDGGVYVLAASPAAGRGRSPRTDDHAALAAPMPATVIAVNVTAGQAVARGDVLVMLEAMKMEIAIRAPRDGTVAAVACQPGELVQPGVPLLELA